MSRNPEGPRLIWSLSKRAFTAGAEQALSQIPELSNEPAGLWKTAPHLYYALGGKRFPGFPEDIDHPLFRTRLEGGSQPIVEYGALYTPVNDRVQEFIIATGNNLLQEYLNRVRKITELSEKRQVVVLPTSGRRNYSIEAIQLL